MSRRGHAKRCHEEVTRRADAKRSVQFRGLTTVPVSKILEEKYKKIISGHDFFLLNYKLDHELLAYSTVIIFSLKNSLKMFQSFGYPLVYAQEVVIICFQRALEYTSIPSSRY